MELKQSKPQHIAMDRAEYTIPQALELLVKPFNR
jgi:hypothetical protein